MKFSDILGQYLKKMIDYEEVIELLSNQSSSVMVKSKGVVYTPLPVAKYMIEMCKPDINDSILENSVGHGMFLYGLLEYIHNTIPSDQLVDWFISRVMATDISEVAVNECRQLISAYFLRNHNIDVPPEKFTNIVEMDGLDVSGKFDLVIGNPPYVRTRNIDENYLMRIRKDFATCRSGNIDLYYGFVEHALYHGKEICLIVPNSILTNVSAKALRKLYEQRLIRIIDFKEEKIFDGIGAYTCIIHIGETVRPSIDIALQSNKNYVLSGIATLADSVYRVKKVGDVYQANDGTIIEGNIVVPLLKITKNDIQYIIYPYDRDQNIICENTMQEKYPLAHSYLLRQRDRLGLRDKGNTQKYPTWYAYGRKQGFRHFDGDIVAIPTMIGGKSQPIELNVDTLVNQHGKMLFVSGFVISASSELAKFIKTPEWTTWLEQNGKPYSGGYRTITATQLKQIDC